MKTRPETVSDYELRDWLLLFRQDAVVALAMVPNLVYSILRNEGHLTSDSTITLSGERLLQ